MTCEKHVIFYNKQQLIPVGLLICYNNRVATKTESYTLGDKQNLIWVNNTLDGLFDDHNFN